MYPLLSNYNMAMVNLWALENIQPVPLSCTVVSWAGIAMKKTVRYKRGKVDAIKVKYKCYRFQSALMDSLMRFLSMYRASSKMALRMIVGGQFTVDLKLMLLRKMPSFSFLSRKEGNSETFLFTKEIMRLLEVTKGDKNSISKNFVEVMVTENPSKKAIERSEESIYHKTIIKKTEQKLAFSEACQIRLGAKMHIKAMEKKNEERKADNQENEMLEKVSKMHIIR